MSSENAVLNDIGKIVQVIGPVVDVEFSSGDLPEIYDALQIVADDGTKTTVEVQQLLGQNVVRSVAMSSTDGLKRGMKVINTKEPIKVPVGKAVLGRSHPNTDVYSHRYRKAAATLATKTDRPFMNFSFPDEA